MTDIICLFQTITMSIVAALAGLLFRRIFAADRDTWLLYDSAAEWEIMSLITKSRKNDSKYVCGEYMKTHRESDRSPVRCACKLWLMTGCVAGAGTRWMDQASAAAWAATHGRERHWCVLYCTVNAVCRGALADWLTSYCCHLLVVTDIGRMLLSVFNHDVTPIVLWRHQLLNQRTGSYYITVIARCMHASLLW